MQEIQAAHVKLDVSENELLPVLNFVAETYVSGLQGSSEIGQAYANQFSQGEPGYSVGLTFEVPWGNRAARMQVARRKLEQRRLISRFEATMQSLRADVEIALREVETSHREMQARLESMRAAQVDVQYLLERWRLLPGDDRSASFLLEDLLDAQDRLTTEEGRYLDSQVAYAISSLNLKRETGILLRSERIEPQRAVAGGLPQLIVDQTGPPSPVSIQPIPR